MNFIEAPCPRTHDVLGRPLDPYCHIWQGLVNQDGYPILKKARVHRLVYQETVGAIPEGYHVDHLCFVRPCVNPAHLEAVTAKENYQRRARRQTHCLRGHEYTPENTRLEIRPDGRTSRNCKTCGRLRSRPNGVRLLAEEAAKLNPLASSASRPNPPELETAKGGSTADEESALSGAGDMAAESGGQLVLAAPEFRKGQVAA